jgi:hypothetical protein
VKAVRNHLHEKRDQHHHVAPSALGVIVLTNRRLLSLTDAPERLVGRADRLAPARHRGHRDQRLKDLGRRCRGKGGRAAQDARGQLRGPTQRQGLVLDGAVEAVVFEEPRGELGSKDGAGNVAAGLAGVVLAAAVFAQWEEARVFGIKAGIAIPEMKTTNL